MARPSTVIVTGATAGVGRAVGRRFACAGDRIGSIARDAEALEAVRPELTAFGADAAGEPADVADADQASAAAASLEAKLGPVDVWINDAMETVFSHGAAEFPRVTEVTYLGIAHGTMAALKSMRPLALVFFAAGAALRASRRWGRDRGLGTDALSD
jgi:NAD(P)-dependent dehydrogenase (short-subunit alcohol dehydrogenase family)